MKKKICLILLVIMSVMIPAAVFAAPQAEAASDKGVEKIPGVPADVAELPYMIAEPWLEIAGSDEQPGMEGPAFDREGNLYVCRTTPPVPGAPMPTIVKIDANKKMTAFYEAPGQIPVGLAFHKDGRLFACSLTGDILVLSKDGKLLETLTPLDEGRRLSINDLVFDKNGNLYFTDFSGSAVDPTGGVYRLDAEGGYKTLYKIAGNMAACNGICLAPNGKTLWVAEPGRNVVVAMNLTEDGKHMEHIQGFSYVYRNSGLTAPDSNKVDAEGNLYQAMQMGGRILVLDPSGLPILNILVPDRAAYNMTPNLAIKPGTKEAYLQGAGPGGTWLFKFEALADGIQLYSHQ